MTLDDSRAAVEAHPTIEASPKPRGGVRVADAFETRPGAFEQLDALHLAVRVRDRRAAIRDHPFANGPGMKPP